MALNTGQSRPNDTASLSGGEKVALAACVAWLLFVVIYFWRLLTAEMVVTGLWLAFATAAFMPLLFVWLVLSNARAARMTRDEMFRLQSALDDLRQIQLAQQAEKPSHATAEPNRPAEQAAPVRTEAPTAKFATRREVSRLITPRAAPQSPADQPTLALDVPEDAPQPLAGPDLIRALNFPDDERDTEGFAALRRALRDRQARRLVQASQDVLTLLSQDGVYTDDFNPDPVAPDLWRQFAKGDRGKDVDRLGAIRDRDALAIAAARMREDTIFRDTVHHFLRRFDEMLVTFEAQATDTDLIALSNTRTARAFMLLARASGTFD
ncbi:hypothetical protein [Yoonia litorea]|uniref:Uncharacterized protein n=1 Tax=Yoonia litorea TaxID=1123755 RepID=A0A1I6L1H3_9RHOB|nr:hypothetical protein [Yoonia litorea]SFR97296.1 hypothetical protein SAMN05444714_0080 [Yoonia litorea]